MRIIVNSKRIIAIVFMYVAFTNVAVAQDISVSSFRLLENDLTANTTGTMERDQNGDIAALIKIVTTEQGFVFDGGMVGIVKTKQGVGEVWVYVPHSIKRITIQHPQLGVLRDYYFPIAINKAQTYEMVLTTGKVETVVTHSVSKQYVSFSVEPAYAVVELDDIPLNVDSEGHAEKAMPYGTYNYRISCANYYTEAGQVTVSAGKKAEVNVALRPNCGWIEFSGANEQYGAYIYIDGERIGQLPLKSQELKLGIHQVKVLKPLYKPFEQEVNVTEGNTISVYVDLIPNFANVTLKTDAESEIWVDGKPYSKGQCVVQLEKGEYLVEVKRPWHRTVSETIYITDLNARNIKIPSPNPIYGMLDITSAPSNAIVYIDGVRVGQTPLLKSDVLTGPRKITFKKDGCEPVEMEVDIKENMENTISAKLNRIVSKNDVDKSKDEPDNNIVLNCKQLYTVRGVSFKMVNIEGGDFMMGATKEQGDEVDDDELPVHSVKLRNYSIGETEVTQELWQAVMGSNPSHFSGNLKLPVENVSWEDCQIFIRKLRKLTGEKFRLPTEAEWEYAARGGNLSEGYKYSGGNSIDEVAWYDPSNTTHTVKTKYPNELGIYDMSGNVSEWCNDFGMAYSPQSKVNPKGASDGTHRVVRGGSWRDTAKNCRVSNRNACLPDRAEQSLGLRLALQLP